MPRTRHTDEQKQGAAQAALDLMLDRQLSQNQACAIVAKKLKPQPTARSVQRWARQFGVDLTHDNGNIITARAHEAVRMYSLMDRRALVDRLLGVIDAQIGVMEEVVAGREPMNPKLAASVQSPYSTALTLAILSDKRAQIEEQMRELGMVEGEFRPLDDDLVRGQKLLAEARGR